MGGYELISRIRRLYSLPIDEKSKRIFWARLKADTADLAMTGKGSGFLIDNWNLPYHPEDLMQLIRLDDCVGDTLVGMINIVDYLRIMPRLSFLVQALQYQK